ncbi:unnamed protein product [Adineta steineri]|uniref:Uncharacterized protein n=1 Tax=Adineta steineri TaxID=433720 RepID=A0A819HPW3_9BILA|nr:unnamed protein product [Adineta steineri]
MLEEHEYDDDNDAVLDPATVRKHQKYKTRLYVVLLAVCLYILFYVTLIKTESKTIMISNVTPDNFKKLYFEHDQTLSCPCSTIAIPYQNFTSSNVTMHSVCSSIFIRPEWIKGLYFSNASQYGAWDFRTTAYSQFELLSSFCSLSKEIISQTEIDINNNELVTLYLLSQEQIELTINGTIDLLKKSASFQMITYLNYSRNTIQTNYLVSALNTNLIIKTKRPLGFIDTDADQVSYSVDRGPNKLCSTERILVDAALSQVIYELIETIRRSKLNPMPNSTIVKGFFTGCTPLEALLKSTLDCLYQTECLQLLVDYFPIRQQINFHANNSVLTSKHENKSVNEYLNNLFIMNWSTEIDYTKYFHQCSPSNCTYSKKDRTELSYGITLFISLYGGLIIILRLIASWSIDILSKIKCCSRETNENSDENGKILKFIESMKRLNLFKNVNDRTENSIKQQKTITCVYLILLTGSICILCLFTSLNSETKTIIERKPSLTTYKSLGIHSATLQCPCLNKAILHQKFVSLSPHFHQICSSGFVHDDWIEMTKWSTAETSRKPRSLKFILNQIEEINSSMITCVCATDPYCKVPAVIYQLVKGSTYFVKNYSIYNVSGWIRGCLAMDSLLLSTLQCLYADSDCFPFLLSYTRRAFDLLGRNQTSLIIRPMVDNPTMSRFPPNTPVSTMFRKMMIEEWNPSPSYPSFYKSCAPIYCTYSQKIRTENFSGVVIKLIATIGGIMALLRIVTPYLIKFILQLPTICKKKEQHQPRERGNESFNQISIDKL